MNRTMDLLVGEMCANIYAKALEEELTDAEFVIYLSRIANNLSREIEVVVTDNIEEAESNNNLANEQ